MRNLSDRDRGIVAGMRRHFAAVPGPLFERSVARAADVADLFTILSTIPPTLPVAWCPGERRWVSAAGPLPPRPAE